MHCRNCGKEVDQDAVVCVSCGAVPRNGKKFCQHCGAETDPAAEICTKCGVRLAVSASELPEKSRMAAGLLGIFLGGLGIHRFYLGYVPIGVAQLVLALLGFVTCGITSVAAGLWGLIEGILILTGTIAKDGNGRPLKD